MKIIRPLVPKIIYFFIAVMATTLVSVPYTRSQARRDNGDEEHLFLDCLRAMCAESRSARKERLTREKRLAEEMDKITNTPPRRLTPEEMARLHVGPRRRAEEFQADEATRTVLFSPPHELTQEERQQLGCADSADWN